MDQLLDKLLESTAKARLLKLFLMNPEREFILQEIVKQTQLKRRIIQKEIAKFVRLGLVKTRTAKAAKDNKRWQKITKAVGGAKVKRVAVKIIKVAKAKKTVKTAGVAGATRNKKVAKVSRKKAKSKK